MNQHMSKVLDGSYTVEGVDNDTAKAIYAYCRNEWDDVRGIFYEVDGALVLTGLEEHDDITVDFIARVHATFGQNELQTYFDAVREIDIHEDMAAGIWYFFNPHRRSKREEARISQIMQELEVVPQ